METGRPPSSDTELVNQARRGDGRAFHALVDRHAAALYALAAMLVGNAADADDVVQETYAGAFRGLAGFRHEASVKTWLTQILVRQAGRFRRDRAKRPVASLEGRDEPSPGNAQGRSDVRMDFQRALTLLGDEHREVIVLRELQGLSYQEIADVLGVPAGTVESRLFRARRQMQELLKDYL